MPLVKSLRCLGRFAPPLFQQGDDSMTVQQAINLLRATKEASRAGTLENVEAVRNSLKTSLSELTGSDFREVLDLTGLRYFFTETKISTIGRLVSWATNND